MSLPPPAAEKDDFIAILSAVMETERGRWFLAEFARRNRHAETDRVLNAIARLEAAMTAPAPLPAPSAPLPAPAETSAAPEVAIIPATSEPCGNDNALAAIDALSVDARLRMFR